MMKSDKIGGVDRYEVENASRSLVDAARVKRDPKLLAAVGEYEAQRETEIRSIADLKRVRATMMKTLKKKG